MAINFHNLFDETLILKYNGVRVLRGTDVFDPEMTLYPRLANECGLKNSLFCPKRDCDEQELKYLVSGGPSSYEKIRRAVQNQPNRIADTTQWSRNEYALVTLNFDTKEQELSKNGYSLRVRFSLNKTGADFSISQIDMCIKTIMPTGTNVVLFKQTRGEWETELHELNPNMQKMIEENVRRVPPLPAFFTNGHIEDKNLFIESMGCTLRNVFPSYEIIQRHNKIWVPEFHHTEDVKNIFLTPYGDILTSFDSEAEAEFVGIHGLEQGEISADKYEKVMRKSMETLDRIIVATDPGLIQRNLLSKAVRARNALEGVYGLPVQTFLDKDFNSQQRIEEASKFSLSQAVTTKDISLSNLWHHIGHLRAEVERQKAPQENPFQYSKYQR